MKQYYTGALNKYKTIIATIEDFSTLTRRNRTIISGRIYFIDGSFLEIYDRWQDDKLERYNYYWLDGDTIIMGWDNKEHHREIDTFPHHKHTKHKKEVLCSYENTLADVLAVINNHLYGK
ncbi:MAG: hypothetical protein IMW95_08390 [Moorella humiferrea]|nr:hypothetical protein [Moorella humiferrea]